MKHYLTFCLAFCMAFALSVAGAARPLAGTQTATVTVTNSQPAVNPDATRQVTFTATVSGASGTPTGSVIFSLNGQDQPPVNLTNGAASFTTNLNAGEYTVTARYAGDATYAAANGSAALSLPKFTQIVSFSQSPAVVYGQDAPINYIPYRIWGMFSSHSPAGTVSVFEDGVPANVAPTGYGFRLLQPKPGLHNIQVTITGSPNFTDATTSGVVGVLKGTVDATLNASRTNVIFGQGVDFTATFTPHAPSPGPLTGTVTFNVNGANKATVPIVNGTATYSDTGFQPGTYYVRATYNGDQNFNSESTFPGVTLNARCGAVLGSQGGEFSETGGMGSVQVTAPAECFWQVSTSDTWIGIGNQTATGLSYTVAPLTTGTFRSGTLTIDGVAYTVVQKRASAPVSAATYATGSVAAEQIVSSYGAGLSDTTAAAQSLPLPTTLAGVTVKVRDKLGVERLAPLLYVSSTQINYLIPAGTAPGDATITFYKNGQTVSTATAPITAFAPGIFTANQNGLGAAAALVQRIKPDGSIVYEGTSVYDPVLQVHVTRAVSVGDGTELVYLLLFATGLRGVGEGHTVTATVGAIPVQVSYAGAQGQYAGLDQINLKLPLTLAGYGLTDVKVYVDGAPLNTVQVRIQ